jgi:heptaprenyl diphosphate synthase
MKPFDITELLNVPDLADYIKRVEKELDSTLLTDIDIIRQPVLRLIKARSKRLRPSLLVAIVVNQGVEIDESVIASCVSLELVHLASLVHDDIIDDADTRWGVPTISAKEGPRHAIIIGDYLFAKANQQAATVSAEVASIIAKTVAELCEGEISEMKDEYNLSRSIGNLLRAIEGKTGSLMSATCQIGGVCAGLNDYEVSLLDRYGKFFGVSFQFVDDILDFLSSDSLLGKPVGNDLVAGVYTMPLLITLNGSDGAVVKKLLGQKTRDDNRITDLMLTNGSIKKSILLAHEYNQLAVKELDNFQDGQVKNSLLKLPDTYFKWALNNLIETKYKARVNKILSGL